ncbi:p-hydroxycinnamoyl CoA hydratase/lyase [Vannielia litorea]|uniref:p-hydroxycinnamoyl CoA hydratase/lyase n=1 Tax=Vannielia litorea TaxID=1217970 RepID=UPI001BCDB94F|nr:p-hydroxycinnamoyl CoA hydratase/lyase [Vannielia litorea]
MMELETIKVEQEGKVAIVTLNRPDKRNAMSPQLHLDMVEVLEELRYRDDINVVVITGAGPAFCGGMDLKEFFLKNRDDKVGFEKAYRAATEWRGRTLRYFPKVTIAMINGFAFGGAFSIIEGCDLAVAADDARMGLSEVNFKLFPGGSVSKSMANLFRPRDALFYGLTGRPFDGVEAARIGFINYSVPADELRENVMALAHEIAAKDGEALRATKDGYRLSLEMSWEASMDYTLAKQDQLTMRQGGGWMDKGIGDFLGKKYKPGLESVES